MALSYKIVSTFKPGEGREGKQIWFPKLTGTKQVGLRKIAKILSTRTTASEADLYLVVMGLVELIPELLLDGNTVKLDNLGTFRLHAKVEPSSSPEKVSAKNIREVRLSFRPDSEVRKQLQQHDIKKEKSVTNKDHL
jgi:predicted histone-like DNA-binding protein